MNHITNRHYVKGPLDKQVIPLIDWPENKHLLVHKGHLYSRRTRAERKDALSAIYYIGEIKPGDFSTRVLPYTLTLNDLHEEDRFKKLVKDVKERVKDHHETFVVLVKLELEFPRFTLTQAFHSSTSAEHIEDFLAFAKTLQFDAEHDDALKPLGALV